MQKVEPIDEEVPFEGGIMITETDLKGKMTYVNRRFVRMSAYEKSELLGQPHSIMRHPDMPKCLFKNMWETLKKGETWKGFVKNLRKDGRYYWVMVYVSCKYDDDGNHVGYIAARKVPEDGSIESVANKYRQILEKECGKDSVEAINNIIGAEMGEAN